MAEKMNKIFILVGPSCAGKTSIAKLVDKLTREEGSASRILVSYTTRPKRESEIDGVDYFFTDQAGMAEQEFLEYEDIIGNRYATTLKSVTSAMGEDFSRWAIGCKTMSGVHDLQAKYGTDIVIPIFIRVSEQTFLTRVRRSRTEDGVEARLKAAYANNELVKPADVKWMVDNNHSISRAAHKVIHIIKTETGNRF